MLEAANRQIRRESEAADRRRLESSRLLALLGAIDGLLMELEELNVVEVRQPPVSERDRACRLIARARGGAATPGVGAPTTVQGLIDALFDAEALVLERRRRTLGPLPDEPPPEPGD